ncbi:MAG TPA: hypothetical protein VKR21_03190 [Solirubrobacteraceae bacterium]|nr:hypothetical protein [Solirubrobacteraceae bacterium]
MTRAAQVTQAVSAMRKARAAPSSPPEPAMTFLIYEDNGGGYHWTIVADGETLVRSASLGSYEQAQQAAGIVHRGASRAAFDPGSTNPPFIDLPARRNAARDRLDAERWLDEGGSFSSQAVTR